MAASASILSRITQRGRPGGWAMTVELLSAMLNLPACNVHLG
jgi:hypothetical protein